ncbi:MAG: aldose epimerase family protein [Gemmatimonadaceae bacterium]
MTDTAAPYGVTPDGQTVHLHTLTSASGMQVSFLTLGGIIVSIRVPDRDGRMDDVVLGRDSLAEYQDPRTPYFGAIVGRYANRIANACFVVDGAKYHLAANVAPNALHGGIRGLDKVVWRAEEAADEATNGANAVTLRYTSPEGEEGYPGMAHFAVTYALSDDGTLSIDYRATVDCATPINLTQHSYFNLGGQASGDALDHALTLFASHFTPVDDALIPTGEMALVDGTPFDFRREETIGRRVGAAHPQLAIGGGYDHNFIIDRAGDSLGSLARAARVVERRSGRTLDIATTEPGVQLYIANTFDGTLRGKGGQRYVRHAGFCLETQHFPDSPNRPEFPSTIVRPGTPFHSRTTFTFGVIR